jgi:hypothetical protein
MTKDTIDSHFVAIAWRLALERSGWLAGLQFAREAAVVETLPAILRDGHVLLLRHVLGSLCLPTPLCWD